MAAPTLSVVLPNYNHSKFLPTALNGLLEKGRQPEDLIVIDDGSTDNSWDIIQDYAARYPCIRAYRNEKNRGPHFTVDRGLMLAQGDYIYSAAADDCVLPGFIEKSMALLGRYPHAGLCCTIGDWREVATGLNWHVGVGMAEVPSYFSPEKMVELELQGRLFIPMNTVIYNRKALLEAGKFLPELKGTCDWFAAHVTGFRQGICFVPEVLAVAEIQPEGYWRKVREDPAAYRAVLETVMSLLTQPKYQDVGEWIRRGGSLYIHGMPMLQVLRSRPEYRRFINAPFLRRCLWHSTKVFLKKFTPTAVGNLYFRLAGYRARTPSPAQAR